MSPQWWQQQDLPPGPAGTWPESPVASKHSPNWHTQQSMLPPHPAHGAHTGPHMGHTRTLHRAHMGHTWGPTQGTHEHSHRVHTGRTRGSTKGTHGAHTDTRTGCTQGAHGAPQRAYTGLHKGHTWGSTKGTHRAYMGHTRGPTQGAHGVHTGCTRTLTQDAEKSQEALLLPRVLPGEHPTKTGGRRAERAAGTHLAQAGSGELAHGVGAGVAGQQWMRPRGHSLVAVQVPHKPTAEEGRGALELHPPHLEVHACGEGEKLPLSSARRPHGESTPPGTAHVAIQGAGAGATGNRR